MSSSYGTDQHCQHISPRGQRCRMLRAADHPSLFRYHVRKALSAGPDTESLAADLISSLKSFSTVESVNQLLGNLVIQLARKCIERRDAIALAYICQLLLNSLTPLRKELRGLDVPADPEAETSAFLVDIRSKMGNLAAARGRYDLDPSPVSPPDHAALPQTQPEPPRDYSSIRT
jgi:hypothetical protein